MDRQNFLPLLEDFEVRGVGAGGLGKDLPPVTLTDA